MTIPTEVAAVLADLKILVDSDALERVYARLESALTAKAEAVAWQSRYRYPLPNGGSAEWHEITKTQFEDREALPGHEKRALHAHAHAPPAVPVASVPDHVRKLVGRIDTYRLRMSYNESYFGEPAGLLKGVLSELAHAINPIYPSGKTALATGQKPEPLGGVVLHLSDGRTVHFSDATPPTNQEGTAP